MVTRNYISNLCYGKLNHTVIILQPRDSMASHTADSLL